MKREYGSLNTEQENGTKFTVFQWNILADHLAHKEKCDPRFLSWDYRKPRIFREIIDRDCDIVCLNEVDKFHDLYLSLQLFGYDGVYASKGQDGSAIFWKSDKIKKLHHEVCLINRNATPIKHIALFALFQFNNNNKDKVWIVATHLKAGLDYGPARNYQTSVLLEEFQKVYQKYQISSEEFSSEKKPSEEKSTATDEISFEYRTSSSSQDKASFIIKNSSDSSSEKKLEKRASEKKPSEKNSPEKNSSEKKPLLKKSPVEKESIPYVFCGDFNDFTSSPVYNLITENKVTSVPYLFKPTLLPIFQNYIVRRDPFLLFLAIIASIVNMFLTPENQNYSFILIIVIIRILVFISIKITPRNSYSHSLSLSSAYSHYKRINGVSEREFKKSVILSQIIPPGRQTDAPYTFFIKKSFFKVRDTIDYIFYSDKTLFPTKLLMIPTRRSLTKPLPSEEFPSDHLNLAAEFQIINNSNN